MGGSDRFVRRGSSSSSNLRAAAEYGRPAACRDESTTHISSVSERMSSLVGFPTAAASTKHPLGILSVLTAGRMRREEFDSVPKSGTLSADSRRWPV